MTFKLTQMIRFHDQIGKIVQLVEFILYDDIMWFLVFFVFMVGFFSFVFQLLGNQVVLKDTELYESAMYFIHSWNQAIKAGLEPNTSIRRKLGDSSEENKANTIFSMGMIGLNWLINLSNDFLMRIVLLSFIIGLVGKSLTKSNENWATNKYKIQCEMNLVASITTIAGSGSQILSASTRINTVLPTTQEFKRQNHKIEHQNKKIDQLNDQIAELKELVI